MSRKARKALCRHGAIMKIWLKIEIILNAILLSIGKFISKSASKITPSSVKETIKTSKTKSFDSKKSFSEFLKRNVSESKKFSSQIVGKSQEKINQIKIAGAKKVIAVKSIDYKKIDSKKVSLALGALLVPIFAKIGKFLSSLNPTTIVISTTALMAFTLTGISVYKQVAEIDEKTKEVVREPSSYSDTMDRKALARSRFRNQDLMFINLSEVVIPIYIEDGKGMQTLQIDFSFKASNRYISKYFEKMENEYLLRDTLNKKLQPIIPSFPMETEGKNILRNKIKEEINLLIEEKGISGTVEDVYIHNILSP